VKGGTEYEDLMKQVIEVRELQKTFRTKIKGSGLKASLKSLISPTTKTVNAVDGISFSVKRGELLAFIGPNGAGKSTTIKLITGILFPNSGFISVLGYDPHRQRKQLSYRIGTVFGQKSQLWFHLPPIDSFHLLGSIYDLDKRKIRKSIDYLTDIFEIGDYISVPVRKLSLGQRIRCEIAASLLHNPEILFLDEPTIGLDVVVKQRIRQLIKQINEEEKVTIFLTSHDAGDIEKICRRAIVINDGKLVWDDSIKRMKYSLLSKRIIDLRIDSPLQFSMEGVKILKRRDYTAKLEVDLTKVDLEEVIHSIIKENKIQDINISNPPMEEVISRIYGGTV
jgi:ABC-2 type transport system ATP-binding protein